jgi:hypothetical protein
MRRLALLPLLCLGCWDFDALTRGTAVDGLADDLAGADLLCQGGNAVEVCNDGIDNDGDCKTDCADEKCRGKDECREIRPLWYGEPVVVKDGAPACKAGTAPAGAALYDGVDPNKKDCSACVCGAATGCATQVSAFSKGNCQAADLIMGYPKPLTGTCTPVVAAASYSIAPPRLTCPVATPTVPAGPGWNQQALLCLGAMADKGCTTVGCVLRQLGGAKGCLALPQGMQQCPPPFNKSSATWHRKYTETRTCTCSCSAPTDQCMGMVGLSTDGTMCTGMTQDLRLDGACRMPMGMFMPAGVRSTLTPRAGSKCAAAGTVGPAAPEQFTEPVTLCCQ